MTVRAEKKKTRGRKRGKKPERKSQLRDLEQGKTERQDRKTAMAINEPAVVRRHKKVSRKPSTVRLEQECIMQ